MSVNCPTCFDDIQCSFIVNTNCFAGFYGRSSLYKSYKLNREKWNVKKLGSTVITIVALIVLMILTGETLPAASEQMQIEHPRLLIRAESGGNPRIVTVEMIRKRAHDPRFDRFKKRLSHSMPNLAMRALAYNDSAAADSAIAQLVKPIRFRGTGWDGYSVLFASLCYDWLFNHPNFDQWEKALAASQITSGARHLYSVLREESQGSTNDYNTLFHPRMTSFAMGLAAAGYALWEDTGKTGGWAGAGQEADRWIRFINNIFERELLPARRILGGSVHNGCGYGRHYVMCMTGHYLSLVYTATGRDLWTEIRKDQDDWAAREALWIIYSRQPDGLMAKYGDCFRRTSERFSFRVIAERSWHYNEPVMQSYLNSLLEEQSESVFELGHDYMAYLYYNPDRQPVAPVTTLPGQTIFGPHGLGQVVWRGWERNDPWIFFKCGDYFTNHDHYDQGHLEVFRHSPLLTEAGAYTGGFSGSNFRMDFYRKSISHNTVLVVDPDDPSDEGGQRVYVNQDLGTMEEYLADQGAETGNIIAYDQGKGLCYLCADLTAAYPPERVQRVTRELAWVAERFLVVRDRVILAYQYGKKFLPKVLWHCPVPPQIGKDGFTVQRGEGQVVVHLLNLEGKKLEWVDGFRVGDKLWEMPHVPDNSDPCVGRVEVVGVAGMQEQEFLQVLEIGPVGSMSGKISLSRDFGETVIKLPGGKKLVLTETGAWLK
jgi:hypothetical protein